MNYYNEWDKPTAAWLTELIRQGHLPKGDVDTRSITEVKAHELRRYTQCHFFAGIGGWSLALQLARWPTNRPVGTGSCPCQPFSIANQGRAGTKCERHLLPVWLALVRQLDLPVWFGEQVPNAIEHGWLDEASRGFEMADYSFGAAVFPANAFGAFHERKRLFFGAYARGERRERYFSRGGFVSGLSPSPLADDSNSFADGRRIMGGNFAHLLPRDGVSVQMERDAVHGYGNAIVPQVAAAFIQAAEEARADLNGLGVRDHVASEIIDLDLP